MCQGLLDVCVNITFIKDIVLFLGIKIACNNRNTPRTFNNVLSWAPYLVEISRPCLAFAQLSKNMKVTK